MALFCRLVSPASSSPPNLPFRHDYCSSKKMLLLLSPSMGMMSIWLVRTLGVTKYDAPSTSFEKPSSSSLFIHGKTLGIINKRNIFKYFLPRDIMVVFCRLVSPAPFPLPFPIYPSPTPTSSPPPPPWRWRGLWTANFVLVPKWHWFTISDHECFPKQNFYNEPSAFFFDASFF